MSSAGAASSTGAASFVSSAGAASSTGAVFSTTSSTIGTRDNFAPSLIDGVTFTMEPIDPGTAPLIKSKLSSRSIFSISRF